MRNVLFSEDVADFSFWQEMNVVSALRTMELVPIW